MCGARRTLSLWPVSCAAVSVSPVRDISWKQFYLISSLDILVLGFKPYEVRRLGRLVLRLGGLVIPQFAFPR